MKKDQRHFGWLSSDFAVQESAASRIFWLLCATSTLGMAGILILKN